MFPPRYPPQTWADPTAAFDATSFNDVEIQVVGTPGAAYTPQRSLDGTTFVACFAYDSNGNAVATISSAGIYTLEGGGFLKLTGGSGSTITARAS